MSINSYMTNPGSILDKFADLADNARIERNTPASRKWFLDRAKSFSHGYTFEKFEKEAQGKFKSRMTIGKVYMFHYSPKFKDTLPYYDLFPLIIVLDISKDHFLGLNLHYLPPKTRAVVLAKLLEITSSKTLDERTKFKLTYGMVKSLSHFKFLKPCIKKYLKSHRKSKLIQIDADELEIVIALPLQSFQKKSDKEVWNISRGSV